jgi:hypothetical protein
MKLGQVLIKKHHISPTLLEQALETQSRRSRPLGELLIGQGLIDAEQLSNALQEQYWRRLGYWVID